MKLVLNGCSKPFDQVLVMGIYVFLEVEAKLDKSLKRYFLIPVEHREQEGGRKEDGNRKPVMKEKHKGLERRKSETRTRKGSIEESKIGI